MPEKELLQVDFCTGYKQWVASIKIDYPATPLPEAGDHVIVKPMDEAIQGGICLEVKRREIAYYDESIVSCVVVWCRIVPPAEQNQLPK